MNIIRWLKRKRMINTQDEYVLNVACTELDLYQKRLQGMLDDPNCRANRAKAMELVLKNCAD